MKEKQIAILLAGCIGLGLIAVIACKFAYHMILVSSGPYSDAQLVAKSVEPIEHVQVSATARLSVTWEVDDRFLLECGDDVVIRQGTNVKELSEKWGAEYVTQDLDPHTSTEGNAYVVRDVTDDLQRMFMSLKVDKAGVVISVRVICREKKGVKIVDSRSSQSISLYDATYEELASFFRSLPK
ncbi:MAG: hypothetical protein U0894_04715 [Pirellulales bacterium]